MAIVLFLLALVDQQPAAMDVDQQPAAYCVVLVEEEMMMTIGAIGKVNGF